MHTYSYKDKLTAAGNLISSKHLQENINNSQQPIWFFVDVLAFHKSWENTTSNYKNADMENWLPCFCVYPWVKPDGEAKNDINAIVWDKDRDIYRVGRHIINKRDLVS